MFLKHILISKNLLIINKNHYDRWGDEMNINDVKLKKVLYFMQKLTVTAGSKTFEVPRSMILNIDIAKDFDSMIYPMWYICMNLPLWFYAEVAKNPNDISVSMDLQYTMADSDEQLRSPTNALTGEISGSFKAILPHTTQIGDYTIQKQFEKDADAHNQNYAYNEYAFVELALYNKPAYTASFNTLNAVLSSTNLTNALTYCLNRCNITNVLLSNSDNHTTYSEFKICPQSGIANIFRIVEDYKFHSGGSTIFFDLDRSYIISNKIGCYAWGNNEHKVTHIVSMSENNNAVSRFSGLYINKQEKYNLVSIQRESYASQDVGTSPILKSSGETEIFQFVTKQATMSMFTPNKEYIVNIDSPDHSKYNGKYRLYTMSVNMTPAGEFLEPQFHVVLRR